MKKNELSEIDKRFLENLDTNKRFGEWVDEKTKIARIIYDNAHLRLIEFIDGKKGYAAMSKDGQKKLTSMHLNGHLEGYTIHYLDLAFMAIEN